MSEPSAQEFEAVIPEPWRQWLRLNQEQGCDPVALAQRASAEGLPVEAVARLLREGAGGAELWQQLAAAPLTRPEHRPRAWRLDTPLAQLYELPDLLSEEECRELILLIDGSLQPSTVTHGPDDYRRSRTFHLPSGIGPAAVQRLDARLAALIGVPPACSEPLQGQRYGPGDYFRLHTDWFKPGSSEFAEHAVVGGQRTWTVMLYLNTVARGGRTRFPRLERAFAPIAGAGLAWNNLYPDGTPNPDTLHEALPVEEGVKYVITKWFRARPGRNG